MLNACQGLLELRRQCCVSATGCVLDFLKEEGRLQKLIKNTKVPDRKAKGLSFKIHEHEVPVPPKKLEDMKKYPGKNGERILEAKIVNRWACSESPTVWDRLVAWQIPLFGTKRKNGWGYIDLLGLTDAGQPVVVEVKKGLNHSDTPLAALLEALSYAAAVAKHWKKLKAELCSERRLPDNPPATVGLERVGLVVLAHEDYWKHWQKPKGEFAKRICDFNELLDQCRGFVSSISLCCLDSESDPRVIHSWKALPDTPLGFKQ